MSTYFRAPEERQIPVSAQAAAVGAIFSAAARRLFIFCVAYLGLTPQAHHLPPLRGSGPRLEIQRFMQCFGRVAVHHYPRVVDR